MKSLKEHSEEYNLLKQKSIQNIINALGNKHKSILENVTRDETYFWAVHADLYDMLDKASNPVKFAKELYKKITDKRRISALDYFLDMFKNEKIKKI